MRKDESERDRPLTRAEYEEAAQALALALFYASLPPKVLKALEIARKLECERSQ
jgi:hypothetical protein